MKLQKGLLKTTAEEEKHNITFIVWLMNVKLLNAVARVFIVCNIVRDIDLVLFILQWSTVRECADSSSI